MSYYSAFDGDSSDASYTTAMDYLINTTNALHLTNTNTTITETNHLTVTSINPCLDLFLQLVQQHSSSSNQYLTQLLQQSWTLNPLTTLKVIFNSMRILTTLSEATEENFYTSALWLYENHPKTLVLNVEKFVKLGYLNYLVKIVYKIIDRPQKVVIREKAKEVKVIVKRKGKTIKKADKDAVMRDRLKVKVPEQKKRKRVTENSEAKTKEMEKKENDRKFRMKQKEFRRVRDEKYYCDENYKLLNDEISSVFAKLMKLDMMYLGSGETKRISLAAQWLAYCDKAEAFKASIGESFFPRQEYKGDEELYVKWVCNTFIRNVMRPLRTALGYPNVSMSARLAEYEESFPQDFALLPHESVMEAVISAKLYQQLVVYD